MALSPLVRCLPTSRKTGCTGMPCTQSRASSARVDRSPPRTANYSASFRRRRLPPAQKPASASGSASASLASLDRTSEAGRPVNAAPARVWCGAGWTGAARRRPPAEPRASARAATAGPLTTGKYPPTLASAQNLPSRPRVLHAPGRFAREHCRGDFSDQRIASVPLRRAPKGPVALLHPE